MAWQNDTEKKPGKPISNYFDFKYAVNIYIDSQQNFWYYMPTSSFKTKKKKNQKVGHYKNVQNWKRDKIQFFIHSFTNFS